MGKADHLTEHRFKPGQSGNPKGRPKGTTLTDRLRKLLDANEGEGAQAFVQTAYDYAMKGDFRFWNAILERIDGKVTEKLEAVTDNTVRVVFESEPPKAVEGDN